MTLVESRERLGGRASSFFDAKSGLWLDNCQHVTLGCCSAYLGLLSRLGVERAIRWDDEQYWVEAGGRTTVLRPGRLPAPMHGLPSFLRARFLTVAEKARIAGALAQMGLLRRFDHEAQTFGQLLDDLGQRDSERRKFWDPIIISACNLHPDRVSALPAIQVFQDAFLAGARASRMGVLMVPLGSIYERAREAIRNAGGRLILGESVARFGARVATLASGQTLDADAVICALPFEKAFLCAEDELKRRDERFAGLARMKHSPILGVHLFFDRPVMRLPHSVLVGRETQWLFRKDPEGKVIHAVVSAADGWMPLEPEEITRRVLGDLLACFPQAASAELRLSRPVKERRASFAYTPGFEALRPASVSEEADTPVLAGDYTSTGWPATMEGAARSGCSAAALFRRPERALV